jgi:hypothetical protein
MSGEAVMQKWAIVGNETAVCLHGEVFNHPDHPDGKLITTPPIVRRFLEEDGSVIYVAKNRAMFKLGDVEPQYEEDFPGAFERIVEEIKSGVPVCPGAPVGPPGPAPQPAVIIEEKPKMGSFPLPAIFAAPPVMSPGTPIPALIRSTDRLPNVALFWWRPVEQDEKTDLERDEEDFERFPGPLLVEKELAKKMYLAGCAAARARKL